MNTLTLIAVFCITLLILYIIVKLTEITLRRLKTLIHIAFTTILFIAIIIAILSVL